MNRRMTLLAASAVAALLAAARPAAAETIVLACPGTERAEGATAVITVDYAARTMSRHMLNQDGSLTAATPQRGPARIGDELIVHENRHPNQPRNYMRFMLNRYSAVLTIEAYAGADTTTTYWRPSRPFQRERQF